MNFESIVTLKDLFYLFFGLILGLLFGIGIYWWPLGQLQNELTSLVNLVGKKYPRNSNVLVRSGTELKLVGVASYPNILTSDKEMSIWHDEGVGWFHTNQGWRRARVLQVFDSSFGASLHVYRICHLDLKLT